MRIVVCSSFAPAEHSQHDAFADQLAVPARLLHRLPDNLGFLEAAMIEPVLIAVHAVQRAGVRAGDTAMVLHQSRLPNLPRTPLYQA